MDAKVLEGKVVAVTGAGREIALLAGSEGAKVVVNDFGGSAEGVGGDAGPAFSVVSEILAAGGTAVANTASVADAKGAYSIIETALDSFGRIDSVINNAGILRDKMFHKMSIEDFESVIQVHLMGSFYVSRAAAEHFRAQESGTMVHFTSTSGLIGNYGQANYAAAKMGIVGLSSSIALDMARYNVRSNCIAPFAWSRLIGTMPTDTPEEAARVDRMKMMGPEKIAPLVAYLASDLSQGVSGQIFAVRMNEIFLFNQNRPVRSIANAAGWTPQSIAEHAMGAFKPSMRSLERTSDVISWPPI